MARRQDDSGPRQVSIATGTGTSGEPVSTRGHPAGRETGLVGPLGGRCGVSKVVAGDARDGQPFGDRRGRVVEEDRNPVDVAELAGCDEGAEVDGIKVLQVTQVDDQPQGTHSPHGVHEAATRTYAWTPAYCSSGWTPCSASTPHHRRSHGC